MLYILYIGIRCYFRPQDGEALPESERKRFSFAQKLAMTRQSIAPIILILAVIGTVFGGIATPTEASGLGAFGALIVCAIHRRLTVSNVREALFSTMRAIGQVIWIAIGASIFIGVYTLAGGADFVKELLLALPYGKWGTFIAIQLILFVMGMVMDIVGVIILSVPIFIPVIKELGFDPLWFGVIFNVNLQLALLSPPLGYSMFYLKGVCPPEVTMMTLYRSVIPFLCHSNSWSYSMAFYSHKFVSGYTNLMVK